MRIITIVPLLLLAACEAAAPAPGAQHATSNNNAARQCNRMLVGGTPPRISRPSPEAGARSLCYRAFMVHHSPEARTPLWAAELLTDASIDIARSVPRVDEFHPESALPAEERAELNDYVGSGYDRGHLAPSANMPSPAAMAESFSLANIIPQHPDLNRDDWADLEENVRRQADVTRVFVVTGPLTRGETAEFLNDRVLVPTHVWKAVYAENLGAVVFVAENNADARWSQMTVEQFSSWAGVDPFPSLAPQYRRSNGARLRALAENTVPENKGSTPGPPKRSCQQRIYNPDGSLDHAATYLACNKERGR